MGDPREQPVAGRSALVATAAVAAAALSVQAILAWVYVSRDPYAAQYVADAHAYHELALRWAGGGLADEGVFHQAPLFPALLALVYRWVEESAHAWGALTLVALLHVVAVTLMVPLGRLWFGSTRVGVVAAVLVLLHGPAALYGLKLLPVSLALATQGAGLIALALARRRPGFATAGLAGVAWGVAALARGEMLLFVPVAAAAVMAAGTGARPVGRRAGLATTLIAGAVLATLPAHVHNARHGDVVPIASSGGENLFIGNQRGATGTYRALAPGVSDIFTQRVAAAAIPRQQLGRPLKPSEVSAYWRGRAWREIAADPLDWLRLEGNKLALALHPGDAPEIYSFALERNLFVWPLWALVVGPWTLLALGAAGLVLDLREHLRQRWPLLAFLALHLTILMAFFVDGRLRLPWLVFFAPFGGHAVVRVVSLWRAHRPRPLAWVAAIALAATVISALATRPISRDRRRVGAVLSMQGRLDDSLAALAPELAREAADPLVVELAAFVHEKRGDLDEARRLYLRALESDALEDFKRTQIRTRLAGVLERLGDLREAAANHDAAVASAAANADTYYRRGLFRLAHGNPQGARQDFESAIRLDPQWPPPRQALARMNR